MIKCRKCGRNLKNPVSVRLGIGPTCLRKELGPKLYPARKGIIYPKLLKEDEENIRQDRDPKLPVS